ncbi:glycosyltransferase family 2 protein [Oscillospiraceae bacterium 50-16]
MEDEIKQVDWSKWDSKEDCFAKYRHVSSELIYGQLPEKKPDISIMIPTYRRADLLKEAIESALNQKTQFSYTISVIDNDSDIDLDTDKLMQEYCAEHQNILYYRNAQNIGMFGNLNRCIELSQTEWLCLLHDDDMLMENYIETLFPVAKNSGYGVVGSYKKIFDQRGDINLRLSETGRSNFLQFLIKIFIWAKHGKPIPMRFVDMVHTIIFSSTTNLLNKEVLVAAGGYDDAFFPATDSFCYAKINKLLDARIAFVPLQLYHYRISRNESLGEETRWKAIYMESALVKLISKEVGLSEMKCKKHFEESVIIEYNIFVDTNKILSIEDVIRCFNLPDKYYNKLLQNWIMLKFNLRWGLLLFRKPSAQRRSNRH